MSKVLFGGKVLREPRAATQLRVGIPATVNPDATNRVLVIGPADGGLTVADGKVYTFSNAAEARAVLRGGDALRAIRMIFNPSPSFGGAAEVDFIRMDVSAAYASTTFTTTDLTFTAIDRGTWTNAIQLIVTGGGSTRTIDLKVPEPVIQKGTDGSVTGAIFTSATAKFKTKGARAGDYLWLSASTAGSQVFQILTVDSETQVTLATSPTAGALQTWSHFVYGPTRSSGSLSSNAEIALWVEQNASDVLTTTVAGTTLPTAATKNLTGGVQSSGGTTEITNALTLARDLDVRHVFVARACGAGADELEFAGLVRGHLLNDAEVPAIGYLGAGLGEDRATAISYAGTLNSARLVYCYQTIYDTTEDGLSVEALPAMFLAAKACGLAAGLPPQTPLTRKALDLRGVKPATADTGSFDRSAREKLLKAGVFHVFQQPGTTEWVVNQGITTIQKQDNLWDATTATSPEISLMRIADTLLYNMRRSADQTFIGGTASIGKAVVEGWAKSYLESERGNLITDWRNLVVTQVADQFKVEFGFVPNNPINFVLIVGTVIG